MGETTRLQDVRKRLEEAAKNLVHAKHHAECIETLDDAQDRYEEALTAITAEDMLLLIGK
ncbi:hypothetical protein [Serratia marcescens]|uniref:hypothetical protein n=1 Tax=Serratia TaxID=613 RepID=UPI003B9EE7CF